MGEQRFEAIGSRGMLVAASAMIRLTRVAFGIAKNPPDHEKAPLDDEQFGFPDDLAPARESQGPVERYAIRLASTTDHRSAVMCLIRKRYQWRGYSADTMRADPTGVTLMASESGRIAGTVTVGFDSPDGMAAESLYADEVARLRRDGARLCELTRLAVDRAGHSMELLGALFHVAYLYARRMGDATHLLAEVNPRHVRFYSRMLGFSIAGPLRTCRRVDAPAVMIALSLDHAAGEIARFSGHPELARVRRSLYPFFLPTGEEGRIIARLFGTDRAQGSAGLPMAFHS